MGRLAPLWRVWKSARGIPPGLFYGCGRKWTLREKNTQLEQQRQAALVRAQEQRGQAEAKRQSLQSIAQQRSGLEREAQSLREREREVTAQRENVGRELARLQERSENLQKEYDAILSRMWEEYELTRREAEEVGERIEDLPTPSAAWRS